MNLRNLIEEKYKDSIKSKLSDTTNTLRLIKSAIKDKDIENRSKTQEDEIDDQKIMSLLQNLIKQRKDSIESFKVASRNDLIEKEQAEIDLISQFLPKQLNDEEIESVIREIIKSNGFNSVKDMGKLMNLVKTKYSGSIDMAMVGKIAKSLLNN
ncbi:MAG: hypothetical protein CFH18_00343 [Alphaproteobacteria bacterium MarineAlpha5_Bin8]|nr:MAG: hypothetical protein CFH17_00707 [Alphaproteobacteria bacterium MarineAlpha5_Bin7]PPR47888.1 MAG: hypothetical protein CFH18_00343 [Alphaproteobacteria bacterium MarineAlpha5_Bin8]PPR52618.1 MAG: hypothetical protein CFH16_01355 [Alphaproteobacteria bacterium MarineAlpha5_Bin6]|tara:strand:+ start:1804 stop:2265 length:462 start_codon:yes stop_codon:yes gene_type:complete